MTRVLGLLGAAAYAVLGVALLVVVVLVALLLLGWRGLSY